MTHPWEEVVGICAKQEVFMRLQPTFESHEILVQFMHGQRAALARLRDQVRLFYQPNRASPVVATDFETLKDLPGGTLVLFLSARYRSSTGHWQSPQMLGANLDMVTSMTTGNIHIRRLIFVEIPLEDSIHTLSYALIISIWCSSSQAQRGR